MSPLLMLELNSHLEDACVTFRRFERPGTFHTKAIIWPEFARSGTAIPTRAAICRDCHEVILNPVGSVWGAHAVAAGEPAALNTEEPAP